MLLVGLGVRELAWPPPLIAEVKQALRSLTLERGRRAAAEAVQERRRRGRAVAAAALCRSDRWYDRACGGRRAESDPQRQLRASALILAGTCTQDRRHARGDGAAADPRLRRRPRSCSWSSSATDWFDGRLARRWNVSSTLGSFLDTTADKLLVTGMLVALVAVDRASPWIAAGHHRPRDDRARTARPPSPRRGSTSRRRCSGKWKATLQFVAIALAILRPDVIIAGAYLDQWVLVIAAVVTAWSGVDYFVRFSSSLRERYVSRVFVTGGSGVVGRALVERWSRAATR